MKIAFRFNWKLDAKRLCKLIRPDYYRFCIQSVRCDVCVSLLRHYSSMNEKKGLIYCVAFKKTQLKTCCHTVIHVPISTKNERWASVHIDAIHCLDDNQLVRTQTNNLKGYLSKKKKFVNEVFVPLLEIFYVDKM